MGTIAGGKSFLVTPVRETVFSISANRENISKSKTKTRKNRLIDLHKENEIKPVTNFASKSISFNPVIGKVDAVNSPTGSILSLQDRISNMLNRATTISLNDAIPQVGMFSPPKQPVQPSVNISAIEEKTIISTKLAVVKGEITNPDRTYNQPANDETALINPDNKPALMGTADLSWLPWVLFGGIALLFVKGGK